MQPKLFIENELIEGHTPYSLSTQDKVDAPTAKVDSPYAKVDTPQSKIDAPQAKIDSPVNSLN